jgi:hypothetical protein
VPGHILGNCLVEQRHSLVGVSAVHQSIGQGKGKVQAFRPAVMIDFRQTADGRQGQAALDLGQQVGGRYQGSSRVGDQSLVDQLLGKIDLIMDQGLASLAEHP